MSSSFGEKPDLTEWDEDAIFMKLWQSKKEAEQARSMIKHFESQINGWNGVYDDVLQELNRRGKTAMDIDKAMKKFDDGNKTLMKVDLNQNS